MITLQRVSIRDNYSSSHAGGILLFGSNMTALDCEVLNVRPRGAEQTGREECVGGQQSGYEWMHLLPTPCVSEAALVCWLSGVPWPTAVGCWPQP